MYPNHGTADSDAHDIQRMAQQEQDKMEYGKYADLVGTVRSQSEIEGRLNKATAPENFPGWFPDSWRNTRQRFIDAARKRSPKTDEEKTMQKQAIAAMEGFNPVFE